MNNFTFTHVLTIILCTFIALAPTISNADDQNELLKKYPAWHQFQSDKDTMAKLHQIEAFITKHQNKNMIAVFDWDGTLYHEKITVKQPIELRDISKSTDLYYDFRKGSRKGVLEEAGQPTFHIWSATHASNQTKKYKNLNLVPMRVSAKLSSKENFINVVDYDNRLEGEEVIAGKSVASIDEYNKFAQIATFEAGMTPENMHKAVKAYLYDYEPCQYAFFPVLDVYHRFVETGFHVWIVTGSNPYYVKPVLQEIENKCLRTDGTKYNFEIDNKVFNPDSDRMYGNFAQVTNASKKSIVFNDMLDDTRIRPYARLFDFETNQFVDPKSDRAKQLETLDYRYINNRLGKTITVGGYIEHKEKSQVVFIAGNSSSDQNMLEFNLSRPDTMVMGVNPHGGFGEFLASLPSARSISLQVMSQNEHKTLTK